MTVDNERSQELTELRRLLDAYGGDEARWPARARDRLRQLLAVAPDGARLLAEARAFDRALDRAAEPDGMASRALVDRIVAAAAVAPAEMPADRIQQGQVITLPQRARTRPVAEGPSRRQLAAALLAACLLVGIFLGETVRIEPLLQEFAEAVGLSTDYETVNTALADETVEDDAL